MRSWVTRSWHWHQVWIISQIFSHFSNLQSRFVWLSDNYCSICKFIFSPGESLEFNFLCGFTSKTFQIVLQHNPRKGYHSSEFLLVPNIVIYGLEVNFTRWTFHSISKMREMIQNLNKPPQRSSSIRNVFSSKSQAHDHYPLLLRCHNYGV